MNLSFSTRGWLDCSWEENIETAEEMRFGGIEVYNIHKTPALTDRGGPFHKYNTAATVRQLREKKLCIPCFDTSCDISAEDCLDDIRAIMEIAHNMKVPYVCVVALQDNDERIVSALEALLPEAQTRQVTILIKTSGVYADTARLRRLMDDFACDQLAALWDMHHPYRDHNESADTTIRNLGAYVRHVHLRDSDDADTYNLIGEGTLPTREMTMTATSPSNGSRNGWKICRTKRSFIPILSTI